MDAEGTRRDTQELITEGPRYVAHKTSSRRRNAIMLTAVEWILPDIYTGIGALVVFSGVCARAGDTSDK